MGAVCHNTRSTQANETDEDTNNAEGDLFSEEEDEEENKEEDEEDEEEDVFIGQEITAMLTSNDFDKLVVIVLFITVQFEPVPSPTCRTSP